MLLSPAGTQYAALQWFDGKPYLTVYDLSKTSDERVKFLEIEVDKSVVERVLTIHWLNDRSIGVVLAFESYRQGVPVLLTRLFVIDRDISKGRWIPERKRFKWETGQHRASSQFQHDIIDYLPEDPSHVLMAIDLFGRGDALSVVRVNVDTGSTLTVATGDESVAEYDVDQQGRVRLRSEIRDKKRVLFVRDLESKRWSPFQRAERNEAFELRPLSFTEDGQGLFVFKRNPLGFDEIFELGQLRHPLAVQRFDVALAGDVERLQLGNIF